MAKRTETGPPAHASHSLSATKGVPAAAVWAAGLTTAVWLVYVWFFTDAPWLHPELLGTAVYVWNNPEHGTWLEMLGKALDWKAFDPNVNRVRPLNDLVEVIDASARPYLARLAGPHPSAMPSSVATLILVPLFLFPWLRATLKSTTSALLFCLLVVSTIGFLSDVVVYIRPAKKLNLVLFCLSLYLAQRFSEQGRRGWFAGLYGCVLASCFADELGLANFVIIGTLFWTSLFAAPWRRYGVVFLSLPIAFLLITKFVIPAVYETWSVHGRWDALADPKKLAVFSYLLSPEFHLAALRGVARSIMSTLAIGHHTPLTESLTGLLFVGILAIHITKQKPGSIRELASDPLFLTSSLLVATGTYATLLDWYPFPHEISYLGSFNYYYHSSMILVVLLWLASATVALSALVPPRMLVRTNLRTTVIAGACSLLISANFMLFLRVNELVQIIHLYPYSNTALWTSLKQVHEASKPAPERAATVVLTGNADVEAARYQAGLRDLFGDRWHQNDFHRVMGLIAPNPIMSDAHVAHFFRATLPWTPVTVSILQAGRAGWTPHAARPVVAPNDRDAPETPPAVTTIP